MTKRKVIIFLVVVGVLAAIAGLLTGPIVKQKLALDQLRNNGSMIQMGIERYAVDTEGSYPKDIDALLKSGTIEELPDNPLGEGVMQVLPANAAPQPGCFVYVTQGPIVRMATESEMETFASGIAGITEHPIFPAEVDQYWLVFYGPGRGKFSKPRSPYLPRELRQISWEHVCLVLSSGGDYVEL
ncbi:hypothetical protein IIA79_04440 [bacterium]|nr:hypothetical protein [bacterium]